MSFQPNGTPVLAPFALTPDEARRFMEAKNPPPYNQSPRFLDLDRREAFLRGTQYEHQTVDWWGRTADNYETISPRVALSPGFERPMEGLFVAMKRPLVETNIAKMIVNRFTGMLFGEQRLPRVIVENDPDTEALVVAAMKQSRFWSKMRHARKLGGGMGSVMVTVHLRDGKFDVEVHNSKQVSVLWRNKRTWTPAAMLKVWSVFKTETVYDKKARGNVTRQVEWLHRRIITEAEDVVYKPIRADAQSDKGGGWEVESAFSARHDLGMFPGVWVQNHEEEDDPDGDADCEGAWKMIDALDRLLSQINKSDMNTLDPTPVIKRDPLEVNADQPLIGSDNALEVGKSGDAKYLEASGTGAAQAGHSADRLERMILNLCRCTLIDPEKAGGSAVSSLALKLMFAQMIECADELRDQYGAAIVQLLDLIVSIARTVVGRRVELPDGPSGEKRVGVLALSLPPRVVTEAGAGGEVVSRTVEQRLGPGGSIDIKWGPYFDKTPAEEGQDIQNATAAKGGGLIDQETAAKHVATSVFQVRDVQTMLANARYEQSEELESALASAEAGVTGAALGKLVDKGAVGGPPTGTAPRDAGGGRSANT